MNDYSKDDRNRNQKFDLDISWLKELKGSITRKEIISIQCEKEKEIYNKIRTKNK